MAYTLLGKDFTPPDVRAKVTDEPLFAGQPIPALAGREQSRGPLDVNTA